MKICSLDPSSTKNLGFAVVDLQNAGDETVVELAAGTFVLEPLGEERWTVLWPLFQVVDLFFTNAQPDLVVVEQTGAFSGSFITSQIANSIGVILACCGKHDVDIVFVYPTHVHKVIYGKGKATKTQIRKAVISILKQLKCDVKFDSEHAYDAIANILCFMHECEEISFKIQRDNS